MVGLPSPVPETLANLVSEKQMEACMAEKRRVVADCQRARRPWQDCYTEGVIAETDCLKQVIKDNKRRKPKIEDDDYDDTVVIL